jgi:peptidoglycan hydrolase-like protein with peptidoglycan-binding domain
VASPGHSRRGPLVIAGIIIAIAAALAAAAVVIASSRASLGSDANALAAIGLPTGGGKIENVTVTTGPQNAPVPVTLRGDRIWPNQMIPANQAVSVDVTIKRPGWISWLAGSTQHVHVQLTTPVASLRAHYITLRSGAPLRLHFRQPIQVISYGQAGALRRHVLSAPSAVVTLPRGATAGTLSVAAAPRTWESSKPALVSWFPAGAAASAVANPAPGSRIRPTTPITLTFNKTVQQVLGRNRPPVTPTTAGTWHAVGAHTIVFRPQAYGYGLGATVHVALPSGVSVVGGAAGGDPSWSVPGGSTLRLQQLLAILNYLPLNFKYSGAGVKPTPQAELNAAIHPPAGKFDWRYPNVPSALRGFWQPGASGVMTQGAVMAFENDHGLATVGLSNPLLWQALIKAAVAGQRSTFGYTFVTVSEGSPETEQTWHNGKTVVSGPVNTGIPAAPTALGTFPVFEHALSVTMSGTNPDGSHYSDPGVPYVSYFNGGDALHGFIRASYGFPQSLGCVEMPYSEASQVYPYTPIGTLVHVE